MMRDHLNQYFEDGQIPDYSDKDKDPFWDPPEPLQVGTCYLQLKALGYMVENSMDAKILSSEGTQGMRGYLNLAYWPCAPNGVDEIDDDMIVDDPSELLGRDVHFRVEINHATDMPSDLCKNVFVTYAFKHEPQTVYSTGECVGQMQNPVFNYKKVHCFDSVSSYMIDYIESGDVSADCYDCCVDRVQSVCVSAVRNQVGQGGPVEARRRSGEKDRDAPERPRCHRQH